jgi:hypothetical protein
LSELQKLTQRLRRDAQAIACLTFVVLIGSVSFSLAVEHLFRIHVLILLAFIPVCAVGVLVMAFTILFLAVHFETIRKRGDVLFKEISDELQWNVRFSDPDGTAPPRRPSFDARLALRSFAHASDLPLVPGRYGPLAYALVDLMSVAVIVIFGGFKTL